MRELADYVVGLGHREIGLLTMRLGRDRSQGLVDADGCAHRRLHVQRERISWRLGSDGRRRRRSEIPDRSRKLRAPADLGRRRRNALRGQPADHRADVYRGFLALSPWITCGHMASTCRGR